MDTADTWRRLASAIDFYEKRGYIYLDMPWTARHEVMMMTCPSEQFIVNSDVGCLVGSSEQSFMEADLMGKLPAGRYMAVTPCFRNDDEDALHKRYFMKLELYVNDAPNHPGVLDTMMDCYAFFEEEIAKALGRRPGYNLASMPTNDGYDIELYGVELGSYGFRLGICEDKIIRWVYATGLAEPRLTRAIEQFKLSHP